MNNEPRIGGSSVSWENCPKCGTKFECYRGGSWDWESKPCPQCRGIELELELSRLEKIAVQKDLASTRYRTRYAEVQAMQWNGGTEILEWAKTLNHHSATTLHWTHFGDPKTEPNNKTLEHLYIATWEGVMAVSLGDYVICGTEKELYPCKPHVFEKKYELKPAAADTNPCVELL